MNSDKGEMPGHRLVACFCLSGLLLLGLGAGAAVVEDVQWRAGDVLLGPGPAGAFDEVAVKDPAVVCHEGRWHVFYTARSKNGYSIGYVGGDSLAAIPAQPRRQLMNLHGNASAYAAAPQVFFFRPQHQWYLIFQTDDANYQPVFSTNADIGRPDDWSAPKPLVQKADSAKWIDFWVICDETTAYLFFTRNHEVVRMLTTPIDRFPKGFANPKDVFSPVHEAIHIYRVAGRDEYHMIYEIRAEGDIRYFGLASATHLSGPWEKVTNLFAAGEQLIFRLPGAHWTEEVSHGEMLRTGMDERFEYTPDHAQLLIQGMPRARHTGDYPSLPWSLGIITKE